MKCRKVTSRIVFAYITVIASAGMIVGCNNEEYEGARLTLATRSTVGTEPNNPNDNSRWKITDSYFGDFKFEEEDSLFAFYVPIQYNPGQVSPIDETMLSKRGENVTYEVKNAVKDKYLVLDPSSFSSTIGHPIWRRDESNSGFEFTVSATIDYTVTIYPIIEIRTDHDGVPSVKKEPDYNNPILIEGSHVELSRVHHGVSQQY